MNNIFLIVCIFMTGVSSLAGIGDGDSRYKKPIVESDYQRTWDELPAPITIEICKARTPSCLEARAALGQLILRRTAEAGAVEAAFQKARAAAKDRYLKLQEEKAREDARIDKMPTGPARKAAREANSKKYENSWQERDDAIEKARMYYFNVESTLFKNGKIMAAQAKKLVARIPELAANEILARYKVFSEEGEGTTTGFQWMVKVGDANIRTREECGYFDQDLGQEIRDISEPQYVTGDVRLLIDSLDDYGKSGLFIRIFKRVGFHYHDGPGECGER